MLRRMRQPVEGPQPTIRFDPWCGDPTAAAVSAALDQGDVATFAAEYERADPLRREHLLFVAIIRESRPAVTRWPEIEPDRPIAWLALGAQRVFEAWDARGSGQSDTVADNAWDVFFEHLRAAEADLRRSIELHDDGVAWGISLASGRGLQITTDELEARYERVLDANPHLSYACDQLLQGLCKKWGGSHEKMFECARGISGAIPDGDDRHRLIAIAHFEVLVELGDDEASVHAYRNDVAVQNEIANAAMRSAFRPGYGMTPQERTTINWFAQVLGRFNRMDLARPLLEQIGASPCPDAWAYFADDAERTLGEWRTQAGLPRIPA